MEALTITKDNFKEEVLESHKPVLVDFWAAWCGPCKMMGPVMDEVAQARSDIKVAKVNIDDCPELAREYMVMSVPTLILFEQGEVKQTSIGLISKEEIELLLT